MTSNIESKSEAKVNLDQNDCFWYSVYGLLHNNYGSPKADFLLKKLKGPLGCQVSKAEIKAQIELFPIVHEIFAISENDNYVNVFDGKISVSIIIKKIIKHYGHAIITCGKLFTVSIDDVSYINIPKHKSTHTFALVHTENKETPYFYYDQYKQLYIPEIVTDKILQTIQIGAIEGDLSIRIYVIDFSFANLIVKKMAI